MTTNGRFKRYVKLVTNKDLEFKIDGATAFKHLKLIFDLAKHCGKEISDEQIQYCEEWLFDCVHDTGYCSVSTPLQIFNDSCDEFKNENN
jgi:hypothetical protein